MEDALAKSPGIELVGATPDLTVNREGDWLVIREADGVEVDRLHQSESRLVTASINQERWLRTMITAIVSATIGSTK